MSPAINLATSTHFPTNSNVNFKLIAKIMPMPMGIENTCHNYYCRNNLNIKSEGSSGFLNTKMYFIQVSITVVGCVDLSSLLLRSVCVCVFVHG